jgi:glycogen debranching enzyme
LLQSPTQAWSAGCLIDLYMDAADEQAKLELPLR